MKNNHAIRIGLLALVVAAIAPGCAKDKLTAGAAGPITQPRTDTVAVPAGTSVVVSLVTPLSTATNRSGDPFTATTTESITIGGRDVIPNGALVRGVLQDVQASGRVEGRAAMTLVFQQMLDARGVSHAIVADALILQAESGTKDDITKIAAGGIAGAVIGAIAGGGKGALIGTAVGAGAGTIVVLATKGDEIELSPGQKLNAYVTSPASEKLVARN